jgi:ferredoxin
MEERVRIIAESSEGIAVELSAAPGGALIDALDVVGSPVPFSCRSAACGTCRIEVLDGAEQLTAPAQDELDLLCIFDADVACVRLACQARLTASAEKLRVRAVQS